MRETLSDFLVRQHSKQIRHYIGAHPLHSSFYLFGAALATVPCVRNSTRSI